MLNMNRGRIGKIHSIAHLLSIHPRVTHLLLPVNEDLAHVMHIYPTAHYPHTQISDARDSGTFRMRETPELMAELKAAGVTPARNGDFYTYRLPDHFQPDKCDQVATHIAEQFKPAMERAFKAAALARSGKITAVEGKTHTYQITGTTRPDRTYTVFIPPRDRKAWTCTCPDFRGTKGLAGRAPYLKNGRRCKHLFAAWMFENLVLPAKKKEPSSPHEKSPSKSVSADTQPSQPTTTCASRPDPTLVIARYADGRPARLNNGACIRYTAGGQPVQIPASAF